MTSQELKDKISTAFEKHLGIQASQAQALLPTKDAAGKVYEAYVFSLFARDLVMREGCTLRLNSGSKIQFKSSPGPINPSYPHVRVTRGNVRLGDIWTDVEFASYSYWQSGMSTPPTPGQFHELDLLLTVPNSTGRPTPDKILIGVECKDTIYRKSLLREILGVRRELSLLQPAKSTSFRFWPRATVPADPPSCLLVYASSPRINNYDSPGELFGIDFFYEPI